MDNDSYLNNLKEFTVFKKKPKEPEVKNPPLPIVSQKIKSLNINVLPPDLKKLALTWPVAVKKKTGFANKYTTNNGKPFSVNQINTYQKSFVKALEYMQHITDPGPYQDVFNFSIEFTNEKLMFFFFLSDIDRDVGWCYSPVDKHVYLFEGTSDGEGFGKNEKQTTKFPYKQWIQLWNKASTLKLEVYKDQYDTEPDWSLIRGCVNKRGKIHPTCKPFHYHPKAKKYCLNIIKKLPPKIQKLFVGLDQASLYLKEDDTKMNISKDDNISFFTTIYCENFYKDKRKAVILKKGLYPIADVLHYTVLIDIKTKGNPVLLLGRSYKIIQWFDSLNEFLKSLTLFPAFAKDMLKTIHDAHKK